MCDKSFARKYTLNKHIAAHTSEKERYQWDHCYKSFITNSNLKCHMLKHTDEKQYNWSVGSIIYYN